MSDKSYTPPLKKLLRFILDPLDGWLLLFLGAIYLLSLFVLYSADDQSFNRLHNKMVYTILGFGVMWLLARTRPVLLMNFALPMYVLGIILLLAVDQFGLIVNGSRRWLELGITRIQPSEIMKIVLPMTLAWYFYKYDNLIDWRHYLLACVLIIIPGVLILKQPDLGTATLIMASGFFVVFFAGLPWKVLLIVGASFLASLPVVWEFGLHDYQRKRVMTLLDPMQDPLGAGYHIIQSMIAIGSGGIYGKGWLNGTQTHLDYIPEKTTDFIFAVYAEELGLIGNILLLVLYTLVIGRCMMIAGRATNQFSRLLAGALTMTFFFYAFVNMGMVSGILPVVGVPLPLVSYGGTATLSILIGQGLLMSIANQSSKR